VGFLRRQEPFPDGIRGRQILRFSGDLSTSAPNKPGIGQNNGLDRHIFDASSIRHPGQKNIGDL